MVSHKTFANFALSCGVLAIGLSAQPVAPSSLVPDRSGARPEQAEKQAELTPEMRGDIFMARKMYREAIDVFRTAGEEQPVICNKIGIAYHQMTDLKSAKKYYEKAIKINSQYSEAINNLGTVYYAQKSYRRAIGQYKKSLKVAPNSASVYSNLGTAYFARKNYNEAVAAYQHALSLDPDVFEHKNTHGVLLQERTYTERAKFHYYVAKMYAKSGQNERALLYMRKALEEGFKEKNKFLEDPEFEALRQTDEFKELIAMEPRVL